MLCGCPSPHSKTPFLWEIRCSICPCYICRWGRCERACLLTSTSAPENGHVTSICVPWGINSVMWPLPIIREARELVPDWAHFFQQQFCTSRGQAVSGPLPVFVNKNVLEHSHARSFLRDLWLLLRCYRGTEKLQQKPYDLQILNYFLFGTFTQNKNCQPLGCSLDLDCPPKVCVTGTSRLCYRSSDSLKRWGLHWEPWRTYWDPDPSPFLPGTSEIGGSAPCVSTTTAKRRRIIENSTAMSQNQSFRLKNGLITGFSCTHRKLPAIPALPLGVWNF